MRWNCDAAQNTRLPNQVMGDIRAQIAACNNGEKAILDLLRPLGLKELVRTGAVAIGRGAKGWKG